MYPLFRLPLSAQLALSHSCPRLARDLRRDPSTQYSLRKHLDTIFERLERLLHRRNGGRAKDQVRTQRPRRRDLEELFDVLLDLRRHGRASELVFGQVEERRRATHDVRVVLERGAETFGLESGPDDVRDDAVGVFGPGWEPASVRIGKRLMGLPVSCGMRDSLRRGNGHLGCECVVGGRVLEEEDGAASPEP